MEPDYFQR